MQVMQSDFRNISTFLHELWFKNCLTNEEWKNLRQTTIVSHICSNSITKNFPVNVIHLPLTFHVLRMQTSPLCRWPPNEAQGLYLSALHRELSIYGDAHNSKTTIPPVWKSYVTTFWCGNFTARLFDVVSHTLSGNYGAQHWSLPHRNCNYNPVLK
jgi:hypothetical protein